MLSSVLCNMLKVSLSALCLARNVCQVDLVEESVWLVEKGCCEVLEYMSSAQNIVLRGWNSIAASGNEDMRPSKKLSVD